jgi:hypothetical protein
LLLPIYRTTADKNHHSITRSPDIHTEYINVDDDIVLARTVFWLTKDLSTWRTALQNLAGGHDGTLLRSEHVPPNPSFSLSVFHHFRQYLLLLDL